MVSGRERRLGMAAGLLLLLLAVSVVESSEDHVKALSRMKRSTGMADGEVERAERQRREVARVRIESEMCLDQKAGKNATISRSASSSLKEKPVGCVLERLIPAGKTFLVTFQHDQSGDEPDICWKTCQAVFPNTSLALVSWSPPPAASANETSQTHVGGLNCHCGLHDAVRQTTLGPDRCCSARCKKDSMPCGGKLVLEEGFDVEKCFSVYCIPQEEGAKQQQQPKSRTKRSLMSDLVRSEEKGMEQEKKNSAQDDGEDTSDYGVGGETVDKEVEAMLTAIYLTQLRSNIVSVVMVALLVVLIILVLMLLVWAYLFVDSLDSKETQPAFYRRLSTYRITGSIHHPNSGQGSLPHPSAAAAAAAAALGPQRSTAEIQNIGGGEHGKPSYGATNQAFDPTPDSDPVFSGATAATTAKDEGGEKGIRKASSNEDGPDPAGSKPTNGRSTFFSDTVDSQDSVMTEPSEETKAKAKAAEKGSKRPPPLSRGSSGRRSSGAGTKPPSRSGK